MAKITERDFDRLLAKWRDLQARHDVAWAAYSDAVRRFRAKPTFSTGSRFEEASARVARCQQRLTDIEVHLREAAWDKARQDLFAKARARVPWQSPNVADISAAYDAILASIGAHHLVGRRRAA